MTDEIRDYLHKLLTQAFDKKGLFTASVMPCILFPIREPIFREFIGEKLAVGKGRMADCDLYSRVETFGAWGDIKGAGIYKGVFRECRFYSGLGVWYAGILTELYTPYFCNRQNCRDGVATDGRTDQYG